MENEFFIQKMQFFRQHCLPFQDAPLCKVWYKLNKLCHSKMHPCAQYEIIWTNYAMNVAIWLIIWLESHWSPHVIARFWEHFFKIIAILQVCYFPGNLATYNDTMRRFPNFLIFFLNFLCPFQNAVKTAGMAVPS